MMVTLIFLLAAEVFPGNMEAHPASYIYVNDGKGHFTDIAATKNPDICTYWNGHRSCWANISGDQDKDLGHCRRMDASTDISF